ncbi:MAG TPA: PPC domain-containing DNA-binding protein [Candidatus Saccharimonadales bacterium]|nr:PPC domain-containing DNA-binding protein [Candidatus Saccharimonadales bacterium]
MTYSFDGDTYIVVLKKDEELLQELRNFVQQTDLKAAWLSAVGGALGVELGYYNLEKREYQWRTFEQLCEIVSLQGNISRDEKNKPAIHLHGVFADEAYQTIGGHVNKLIVGGTCEVMLREFSQPLARQFDDETGLRLLQI